MAVSASDRRRRRASAAIAISSLLHVGFLAVLLSVAARPYNLPEPTETVEQQPAMTVEILKRPPPEPPIVPPKMVERKVEAAPPAPAPAPSPPQPVPPTPVPTPPKPIVTSPPKPTPTPAVPLPQVKTQPAPPTPAAKPAPPTPAPAQAVQPAPKLNIHKPEKNAPATIATLPMAPSPSQPKSGAQAGAPAAGGQAAGQPNGSRLSGLTPWPAGGMPSGGTGLRGSLVGCANAQAVKLSGVERAHCNERFGVELSRAPTLDGIPPAKRAQYDAAAAKDDLTRRRMNAAVMRPTGLASPGIPGIGGDIQTGPGSSMAHSASGAPSPHD